MVGAVLGLFFAAYSTYDFMAHLDRQVHGIHCSFLPGLTETEKPGESACAVTMMSPYSSVLRESIWGGIPISLPAMAVFAFIGFAALYLVLSGRQLDKRASGFLLAATCVPFITSAVMAYISFATLDAACKLCIAIYAASLLVFGGALALLVRTVRAERLARSSIPPSDRPSIPPADRTSPRAASDTVPDESFAARVNPVSWAVLGIAFAIGVAFVALPVLAYALVAPDFAHYTGTCGELVAQPDESALVSIGPQGGEVEVLEILDPLCPACRGFEQRFDALDATAEAKRRVLLFPLDDQCNWMVSEAVHPGACAVSEAMLCAEDDAEEVLDWAFAEQERIREAAAADPRAAARLVTQRFPSLRGCVGSPGARAKLNLALRSAVANRMPVLTPQVYVGGVRMCDADTDLGMDYALTRLIQRAKERGPLELPPAEESTPLVVRNQQGPRSRTIQLRPGTERAPQSEPEPEVAPEETPPEVAPEEMPDDPGGEPAGTTEEPTPENTPPTELPPAPPPAPPPSEPPAAGTTPPPPPNPTGGTP